jgi:hypothetical protein
MASVIALMGLAISAPDHTAVSRRAVTLPLVHAKRVPQGPLQVLIAVLGCRSTARADGWRQNMVPNRVGHGASCIRRSMLPLHDRCADAH